MNNQTREVFDRLTFFAKENHGLDITKLNGIRKGPYVRIRASIIVSMMKHFGTKSVEMAEAFNIDHTSVLHHKKNHAGRYQSDDDYAEIFDEISKYAISVRAELVGEDSTELPKVVSLIRGVAS